jgi:hypothetical protein
MGWISGGLADTLAVHAALLPSGQIIYFGGSDYNSDNFKAGCINHTRLYNCATQAISIVKSPTTDTFCCGHALIDGGLLVVAGGLSQNCRPSRPSLGGDSGYLDL